MSRNSDNTYRISVGTSRVSKTWKEKSFTWEEFADRCRNTERTRETEAEYQSMTKTEKGIAKDVGGYVAGTFIGNQRKKSMIQDRCMITLDLDFIPCSAHEVWDRIDGVLPYRLLVYSSHSHTHEKPRLRLVIPMNRLMKLDEYEPIGRKIASLINIEYFDDTTYQMSRLMYWPSTPKDGEFFYKEKEGTVCTPEDILSLYDDWLDVSEWPISSRESEVIVSSMKKAGDPTEKPGIVGTFCRTYSIEDAIETFLSDVYEPTAMDGRYTYKNGSAAGGLVLYEGKFAYSHHDTDPAGKKECNAFDLVRIHKFGHLDKGSTATDVTKLPSYIRMSEFISDDPKTKVQLINEKNKSASEDFKDIEEVDDADLEDDTWKTLLDVTKTGKIQCTLSNFCVIMEHDPKLKNRIWRNDFSSFIEASGLPWKRVEESGRWRDEDDTCLRRYMCDTYQLEGKDKIYDAVVMAATKNRKHPIREYLNSLQWDETPRLESMIIDYLGAEDTPLNRTITRKHFVAAVARIFIPGIKYDNCLTLTGPEETGKSSLFRIMGDEWFDDSVTTIEGKEGLESLRGKWIIELAELTSIKRSQVEQVKSYLSKQVDTYRAAYARNNESYPRQCVFCGTTNEDKFLKGDTGNRRFWVIQIDPALKRKNGSLPDRLQELEDNRNQLWAEAVYYFKKGEKLYLDESESADMRKKQEQFNDDSDDPLREQLQVFFDRKLPINWNTDFDINRRRAYYKDPDPLEAKGTETRDKFVFAEFICEFLGREFGDKDYKYTARKVGLAMRKYFSDDWELIGSTRYAESLYGMQKTYKKIMKEDDEDDL